MEDAKQESKTNGKKKREDKIRRRDARALENILKTMEPMADVEKIQVLKNKYSELYEEHRATQNNLALMEKKGSILQREKDQLQSEHSKSVLARSRLESLCRELQRQNKLIKEENSAKIREEEELRKEVATKFQSTLMEVTTMMQENNVKNLKLRDDNLDMANKIASLCQQFEKGEAEIARMGKQMSLEKQLSDAMRLELRAGRELWGKEREVLQSHLKNQEDTCAALRNNVTSLEEQLQTYTGKYEEFENTFTMSNQVFDNCKSQIGKMSKQITTLEKECKTWKNRWEKNAKAVIDLTGSKQLMETEMGNSEKKIEQLQKLCRQLQVDRAAYLKLLKSNGIEPSSQMCIDTTPIVATAQHKPTKKEQELEMLKNNLKVLQEQFTGLTCNHSDEVSGDKEAKTDESIIVAGTEPSVTEISTNENEPTSATETEPSANVTHKEEPSANATEEEPSEQTSVNGKEQSEIQSTEAVTADGNTNTVPNGVDSTNI